MKVHELVARCAKARESTDPISSIREVLENLRGDIPAIERALKYISGVGGNARQVFYRSPDLTMLKVCFPNGRRTPPHDHGTWATILLLSGEEKNTLYRRENGALRKASEVMAKWG
jgi:predicted metal-dependent enzyme (double-stranded beta helix superfamily)